MKRVYLFQIALAMACALILGHLGDKLLIKQADSLHIAKAK